MANAKYTQPPCDNTHVAEGCEQFSETTDQDLLDTNKSLAKAYAKISFTVIELEKYKTLAEQLTIKVEELSQLVSAKLFLHPQEEWQPIDTAPTDGAPILAWEADKGARETVYSPYREGSIGHDKYLFDGGNRGGFDWEEPHSSWICYWKPTHWMPLPKPPAAKEK